MMVSESKIEYLDTAFWATYESQGFKNAKLAIKYVLFNDDTEIDEKLKKLDKWQFISNINKGRELAKKLNQKDLMHILIKFCFQYFAFLNCPFEIDHEKYLELKDNVFPTMALTTDEIVEFVVFASLIGVDEAYILLSTHNDVVMALVDLFIHERYFLKKNKEYDDFKEISYPRMKMKEYEKFIEKYNNLDWEFSFLKRKDVNYS